MIRKEANMFMHRIGKFIFLASLGFALACSVDSGGSGSNFANGGIGGTGVSEGPITGFGSIFVNGIKWEIDDSEVDFDGAPGTEGDLRIGMVVRVEGEIDSEAGTGQASRVRFDDELEGPITSIDEVGDVGAEDLTLELLILGQRVWVEAGGTRFDDDDDGSPDCGLATIAVGDVVEVSGLRDGDGVIRATYLECEGILSLGNTEVELAGTVSGFSEGDGTTFMIGDVTITFDPTGGMTTLEDLPPGGVADGLFVEVEGKITATNEVFANEIEQEDEFDDDDLDEFSITGFVSDFVGLSDFKVAGRRVDASGAVFENGNALLLEDGVRVEVEGDLVDIDGESVLIADEVEFEDREIEISAAIADAGDIVPAPSETDDDRFFLLGIEILVVPSTIMRDELLPPFGFDDIAAGDYLEVKGVSNGSGAVIASEVRRDEVDDIELEGPVDEFDASTGTLTILGVTVATQTEPTTEFAIDDLPATRAEFFAQLEIGDFVDVEDDESDGDATSIDFASEVELEDEDAFDDD